MITLYELCEKEVIGLSNGTNLGRVDDFCVDETTAQVTALIIFGKPRWFGLLGREDDIEIPWKDIATIGEDAILVRTTLSGAVKKSKHRFRF